jgi:protein-tyrosine phosphatase|tara:strand:- start:1791 stop:2468 length:678 start_codon:yes stop_codon:yes gene_type:complete
VSEVQAKYIDGSTRLNDRSAAAPSISSISRSLQTACRYCNAGEFQGLRERPGLYRSERSSILKREMVRVCFVCLGNICRSPTAEGIMQSLIRDAHLHEQIDVDSAGLGAYHVGAPPDRRAKEASEARGIGLNSRARQFTAEDFSSFDYVIAMDAENRQDLLNLAPDGEARAKVHLLRVFDLTAPADAEVPDPYYGGPHGFDNVFDMCQVACQGLLQTIRAEYQFN